MNCAYHAGNVAVVNCNGCRNPLCPACDHRIKGFPFCQDCIVSGIELLRNRGNSSYVPLIKTQTSPFVATVLSLICPGLGAAYNGQTSKALVHFAAFVGFFQLAVSSRGMAIFVFGFLGMWLYAALDSWRSAQLIRSGITPIGAEDLIFKRISGNPKLWGIVLAVLGITFFLPIRPLMRFILPALLIGLGAYLLRGFFFKSKDAPQAAVDWHDFSNHSQTPGFANTVGETNFRTGEFEKRAKSWKAR